MTRPRIAITMGDPAGIGPEICLRLLAMPEVLEHGVPIVFGDDAVLRRAASAMSLPTAHAVIAEEQWSTEYREIAVPTVVDFQAIDAGEVETGSISIGTGRASYCYIEAAIDAALAGQVDAITTGPIHKEALSAAGVPYPGHTEILAAKTKADRYCMMLTSDEITCALVTTHVGLREVPELLSVQRIVEVIQLSHDAMQQLRGKKPQLAICGLNPHAGEAGLFGDGEEEQFIVPAMEAAREQGIHIEGPLSPDTAFLPERRKATDCYICMYHDQGLIPLKTLAFDLGVNVTLGLPIVRTSVDHGTACDIAGQGRADSTSLLHAFTLAARLVKSSAVSGHANA